MKKKWEKIKIRLAIVICILTIISTVWVLISRLEGKPPEVLTRGLSEAIRASQDIAVSVSDPDSGLRSIRITLLRGRTESVLYEKTFSAGNFLTGLLTGGDQYEKNVLLKIVPRELGISEGRATLHIVARDYAWRNWWNGNKAQIVQEVIIDVQPPKIEVLSQQHNLTQGGSGLVIYRLSEPCPVNGIHVGDNFFPGYAARSVLGESSANTYMSFIALDYRQGRDTRMFVSATDRAGNQSKAGFHFYIRGRNFKKDIIRISDNFLNTKMPEFENETEEGSGSGLIDKFLEINRKLRVRNTDTLKQAAAESDPSLYWKGAFLRLPNSARRANFADHREYHYKDNTVDEQNHMGIDLASTAHAPVPAANAGKVVFTRAVGIYGDTIVLDHGFGLFSTYSHLSHVAVRVGQMVKRGEIIGNTGTTGLAGGDHLHFGMIVHNVFVNPVEWWDSSWIKNNISNKINSAKKR